VAVTRASLSAVEFSWTTEARSTVVGYNFGRSVEAMAVSVWFGPTVTV